MAEEFLTATRSSYLRPVTIEAIIRSFKQTIFSRNTARNAVYIAQSFSWKPVWVIQGIKGFCAWQLTPLHMGL